MRPRHFFLFFAAIVVALAGCEARGLGTGNENSLNQSQNQNSNQVEPPLDILLTVYGATGEVVQTLTVDQMGPVTIRPPADEPDPPEADYVVMAQAEGCYTRLFSCGFGQRLDVQLDGVPELSRALTGVVIRTSYFGPPSYHAELPVQVTDPGSGVTTLTTDAQGRFQVSGVDLGTFTIEVRCNEWEEPLPSRFEIVNSAGTDYRDLFYEIDMYADAPNLYLYPAETTRVTVDLGFPLGGEVTLSDPPYEDGWDVTVAPDGTIDGEYPYLFYEARLPYRVQRAKGHVLAAADLERGLTGLLREQGFVGREITDFLDYWLPLLTGAPYWGVFPLAADELVTLRISPAPDRLRRLWLMLEPLEAPLSVEPPPAPPPLPRDGFTAVEWGAFLP